MTPTTTPETGKREGESLAPLYHVILLDDDQHTYDYVVEMLGALFFLSVEAAYQHAVEVDTQGRTIVTTSERRNPEYPRDQTPGYAATPPMPNSKGPMRAPTQPDNPDPPY